MQRNNICFYEYEDVEIVFGNCIHSFPLHIHETLCVGFIIEGLAQFVKNGVKTILSVGDCYIIPPYTPHSLSSVGAQKFNYITLCFKGSIVPNHLNSVVARARVIIKEADKEFNIKMLSDEVHISKYHLGRIFKEQMGITPYQFYLYTQIKKIRQGLGKGLSLSDLTFDLNFSDQSHLCNTFKKHMGISPLQYLDSFYRN